MDLPDLTPLERRTEELLLKAMKFNEELVRLRERLQQLSPHREPVPEPIEPIRGGDLID